MSNEFNRREMLKWMSAGAGAAETKRSLPQRAGREKHADASLNASLRSITSRNKSVSSFHGSVI